MRIKFVDVFVCLATSRTHTTSETVSHGLLARRDPVVAGSHAKWLPVADTAHVLFMCSRQNCSAWFLSAQIVLRLHAYHASSCFSPSLMGVEDSFPESCHCPQLGTPRNCWSEMATASWSGGGHLCKEAAAAAELCCHLPPPASALLGLGQITLFPSPEMPKACPRQSH